MQHGSAGVSYETADSWIILSDIEQNIKQKIVSVGIPLREWNVSINYGIKTGFNDAFIINTETKDALIAEDPRSAEIIRPILRGRDIKRYGYEWAGLWLIATFPSRQYNIDDYPAIKKFLLSFGMERLEQTGKKYTINGEKVSARKKTSNRWFETQDAISYWDDFSKQKIAYAETMRVHRNAGADRFPRFSYVEEGYFHDKTCFIMTGNDLRYIHAVMNSSLMNYYIHKNIAVLDTGGFLMQKIYVELFPIPQADESTKEYLSQLQQRVIELRQQGRDSSCEENEIDECVYLLFGLSDEEIAYVGDSI